MIDTRQYLFIIISISAGLLSLLGSVGIFISLITQRKVERLQDILEELIEQSYGEDQNLTGTIYRLVQKYQMHYLLPQSTIKTIARYVDATIILVVAIWVFLHFSVLSPPLGWEIPAYFLPVLGAVFLLYFFRKLLKNAIDPFDNPLLNGIIPPPPRLRSISFLSGYVNVSVKALVKHARFVLLVEKAGEEMAKVTLKEELSFDDFFYYISIRDSRRPLFVGSGRILFSFDPDSITGKPTPLQHNINVPLGFCKWQSLTEGKLQGNLLLFPYGEKHPLECTFELSKQGSCYISLSRPETTIANSIVYKIVSGKVIILENKGVFTGLGEAMQNLKGRDFRQYYEGGFSLENLKPCTEKAYID